MLIQFTALLKSIPENRKMFIKYSLSLKRKEKKREGKYMSSFHRNWSGLFHSALCQFLREVEEFTHIPVRFFTLLDLTICFNYCTFESQLCETTF